MKIILALILAAAQLVAADFRLATPFTEHMVLQRDLPLPVWGVGPAGATVSVQLGEVGESATINADGEWRMTLPKQAASGPLTFQVRCQDQEITFEDVVIGEVWICSGQSNMQMGYGGIPEIQSLVNKAKNIRCFEVPRKVSGSKEAFAEGQWRADVPGSAVAAAFACHLQEELGVHVGIILTCWGSSAIEGWMPLELQDQLPHFKAMMEEYGVKDRSKIEAIVARGKWSGPEDIYLRTRPNVIYNQMMHPLIPFACRGLVWYQGEANANSVESMQQYAGSQALWLGRLRELWGQERFYYLGVMLPGFGQTLETSVEKSIDHPAAHSWAWFRESQIKTLNLPDTGIATTIDLGDAKNIHPKDKAPIGGRLAYLALAKVQGKDILAEGPTLREVKIEGGLVRLSFENAKGLRTTDGKPPTAFWLADDAGIWKAAQVRIEGESIILTSDQLTAPKFVRYAFAAMPAVNLVNEANLPARPFRTDSFEPLSSPNPGAVAPPEFRSRRLD